jgi:diacylglycerol kinase family enzyme
VAIVRRVWALASLASLAASVVLAVVVAVEGFPRGLSVLACLLLAAFAAWRALLTGGVARRLFIALAVAALAGAVALVVFEGRPLANALVLVLFGLSVASAREAFTVRVRLAPAPPPRRPVLFFNPKSGGGKAERFRLAEEAAKRGIEAVELTPGTDLRDLVGRAVEEGADALAMAGGDGSQAIVAAIAAERDLPYACIPAGTRNHFALDLGVDRDDVVGALDAFTDGGERRVDLATVNGRVFVNNVSLGVYAEAVQREEYRGAKMRTIAATAADTLAGERPPELHWEGTSGRESGTVILVSNNVYRLGRALGSGMRARLDAGRLGIAVLGSSEVLDPVEDGEPVQRRGRVRLAATRSWSAPRFEVRAATPVPAGIDGEAAVLEPPLDFRLLPGALRVRIAPEHAGASPAAGLPEGPAGLVAELARIAFGSVHRAEGGLAASAAAPDAPELGDRSAP